jgi:carboxymethylenebutenolidase
VRDWAVRIPAGNGRVATVGFCWGGGVSFAYAGARPDLAAAVVFYGTSPEPPVIDAIRAPVLGHYGGDDERVDATIPPVEAQMKKLGRSYEVHVYPGAGHGFLRDQSGRDGANLKATKEAWPGTVAFLKEKLGGQISQR